MGAETGQRADIDDLPALLPAHDRQHRLHHSDDAEEIGLELGLGLVQGEFFQCPGQLIAGIVDQYIQLTDLTGCCFHARRDRVV
jgi:hypothetical protein